jgi:outer membrane lipoprotein carrier protein
MSVSKLLVNLLLGAILQISCAAVFAAETGSQQLRDFLSNNRALQARFSQSVLDQEKQQAAQAHGIIYVQRPGRLRWDYLEPYVQHIVADGTRVWHYDPELEQASTQLQGQAFSGTPALLLSGDEPVEKHFEVIDIGSSQGFEWVELIPRDQESQFVRILLAFAENELQRLEMADKFGQVTRFQFYDMVYNPELSEDIFKLDLPDRYEVFQH